MPQVSYTLLDVFTNTRFGGNQLAVFSDSGDLSTEMMQQIANELNLSESAFVQPATVAEADYRVRFFTPKIELPMAGHPTVGTAYALARQGLHTQPTLRLQQNVGVINVEIENDADDLTIWMNQPLPEFGNIFEDTQILADILSIPASGIDTNYPAQVVSTGVPFLYIPIRDIATMNSLKVRLDLWEKYLKDYATPHIFTFSRETQHAGSTVHSRMFAPAMGIAEDPATGAASGPLGAYLKKYNLVGQAEHIISEQGIMMGRPSFIQIDVSMANGEFSKIRIGGQSVLIGEGQLYI